MVSKLPQEFRRYNRNRNQLRHNFKETQKVLEAIIQENFLPHGNAIEDLLPSRTSERLNRNLYDSPAIVICGQDSRSKAALVNSFFGADVLPLRDGAWRWIKFSYGQSNRVSLTLGLDYEVVEGVRADETSWSTLPVEDLTKSGNEDANCPTILEVRLDRGMLRDGVQVFVVPDIGCALHAVSRGYLRVIPIFLYALSDYPLTEENISELRELRETYPHNSVFFISSLIGVSLNGSDDDLTESERYSGIQNRPILGNASGENDEAEDSTSAERNNSLGLNWLDQLLLLGFLRIDDSPEVDAELKYSSIDGRTSSSSSELVDSCKKIDRILYFVRGCLRACLVDASNLLNQVHTASLRKFILSAFDMAREIQITPRRIQYVQRKEYELHASLMDVVNKNQEELTVLIHNKVQEMIRDLQTDDDCEFARSLFHESNENAEWNKTVRMATVELQRIVLGHLSERVAGEIVTSIDCLRETFVGTLERCLLSLERSYENDASPLASDALKQILSAAYNVELHNSSSPSFMATFVEGVRRILRLLPLPWSPTPNLDAAWRRRVTVDLLNSLSAARLARSISTQFRDRVKSAHDAFVAALRSLENHHSGKLERTEEQRMAIRKIHAPRLAKLALESTSMSDTVRFGIPHQGKEIGRGQYGVVFSCDGWGGAPGPCAIKSVVPPDEKHWNDLAMEFYYTRSIPDHKRIVKLRGSVIDYSYGGGGGAASGGIGAAVLLITDRMSRDLYCGLRAGLSWLERIQIAIDVLEGIRYLHSLGLLHRDIKLKNILLDTSNRAKLTDLGFCITEAMISGSVVGTPVHMAPELLTGQYDSTVDVYAFGILFWYICAGHVKMPYAFEQFNNKDQLWTSVKRGIRPERLAVFDDECWKLMEQCWAGDPCRRPLLGAILPVLEWERNKAEGGGGASPDDRKEFNQQVETSGGNDETQSPALALAEPNNQRGAASNLFPKRRLPRTLKHSILHMTNIFQTSVCSNLYIQMREF